ncbi:MAG: DnaA/Hda family protein [Marinovum sp.]|nr:DnaA/Hda family protein [Marinovum sp.]
MAEQLNFDLSARPALGREAFFVSSANAVALAMIDEWMAWPNGKLLLSGAKGSGKTHLAHVWAEAAGAKIIFATSFAEVDIEQTAAAPVCVEDVDQIGGDGQSETALFHLHNLALAQGQPLLLTGSGTPKDWGIALPDLLSRIQGTNAVRIEPPDEALLGALYGKLFQDRQINPPPDVIPYLARHAPRSFEVVHSVVAQIDAQALSSGRNITRDMARRVLQAYV